jgi:hypothetical protein
MHVQFFICLRTGYEHTYLQIMHEMLFVGQQTQIWLRFESLSLHPTNMVKTESV